MGLFRDIKRHIKNSNAKYLERENREKQYRWAQEEAETRYKNSLECCANCLWFRTYDGKSNHCIKHDFCFDIHDVEYDDITHKKTCSEFYRK